MSEGMRARARTSAAALQPRSASADSRQTPDRLVAKLPGDITPGEAAEAFRKLDELRPEDKRALRAQGTTAAVADNCQEVVKALGESGDKTPKEAKRIPGEPDPKDKRAVHAQRTTAAEAKNYEI